MGLRVYVATPLSSGTEADPDDFAVSDGSSTTFILSSKNITHLSGLIQAGNTLLRKTDGAFTVTSPNIVTLATPQPVNTQIVFPGTTQVVASAFDQAVIPGVTNPRVIAVPFWFADISEIPYFTEEGLAGAFNSPYISIVPLITGVPGALVSWCELCTADGSGNATTYVNATNPYYLKSMTAYSPISASAPSGSTVLNVNSTTGFTAGDLIYINPGLGTQEVVTVTSVGSSTVLNVAPMQFNHYIGENVYVCGVKMFLRVTIPLNYSGGVPTALCNLGIFQSAFKRIRT